MRKPNDIKAPDGFLLGGERRVRRDGTILFQRGWWQAPKEWAGEYCWVHCTDSGIGDLEVAPPGYSSIYRAQSDDKTIFCERTCRSDAKSDVRVQRLHDISEADAIAEGCKGRLGPNPFFPDEWDPSPVERYRILWNSINDQKHPWETNPWVAAYTFKVQQGNIDQVQS